MVFVFEQLAVEHRRAGQDDQAVGALIAAAGQLGIQSALQGEGERIGLLLMDEMSGLLGTEQQGGGRLLVLHHAAALHGLAALHVQQFDLAASQHVAQIDVVRHRLDHGAVVGNAGLRILDDDGHLGAVVGNPQAGTILFAYRAVAVPVVIQVAAVLAAEQFDARVASGMDGLDPAVAQAINRLLEAAAEIAAPAALATRQGAVRSAIGEDEARLGEGHALGLVADHQHRAGLMPLVLDADLPARRCACPFHPGIAVVGVGDQFDQGLLDGSKAARVDIDHPLVHRDRGNGHALLLG
ncbi:hypothetical protein D9M71_381560 [compost metagenome]